MVRDRVTPLKEIAISTLKTLLRIRITTKKSKNPPKKIWVYHHFGGAGIELPAWVPRGPGDANDASPSTAAALNVGEIGGVDGKGFVVGGLVGTSSGPMTRLLTVKTCPPFSPMTLAAD